MLLILLLTLIILCILVRVLHSDIIFLTAEEVRILLYNDDDGYFRSLSPVDLKSRQVKSPSEYLNKIVVRDFTKEQKEKLQKCMKLADYFFQTDFNKNIYGLRIGNIPWRFGLTYGDVYEFGYPHTRVDTIFISDEIFSKDQTYIVKMMIHEKIHLDQKKDQEKYTKLISDMGIQKIQRNPQRTANPDINEYDYYKDGKHPFEEIAYTIDGMYNS
jgi:hypothetical protein